MYKIKSELGLVYIKKNRERDSRGKAALGRGVCECGVFYEVEIQVISYLHLNVYKL